MIRPPLVMRLRVRKGASNFGLWLPVFLLLLPLLLLGLLLAPIVLLVGLLLWPTGFGRTILLVGPVIFGILCASRGLEVDVKKGAEHVTISFR